MEYMYILKHFEITYMMYKYVYLKSSSILINLSLQKLERKMIRHKLKMQQKSGY